MPRAEPQCLDSGFADDVVQVITTQSQSRNILKARVERAINRVNTYEHQWKIKTNRDKFKLVSISKINTPQITIDNVDQPYSRSANVLGLNFARTGITGHFTDKARLAWKSATKLRRFSGLDTKIKLHLYKSLIRSKLEYPAPLLGIQADTNIMKLQTIQNKCLKMLTSTVPEDRNKTMKSLHEKYDLQPMNVRLWRRTKKTWEKLETLKPDLVEKSRALNDRNQNFTPDHYWWRRLGVIENQEEPEPKYVKREINREHQDEDDSDAEENDSEEE